MPQLAMLGDNGGVVTVNPDWCDWYEEVFNEPAGTGYIKGREIMQQVDAVYSEFVGVRSEAVKSAIHTMMQRDPNTTGSRFNTIAEARAVIDRGQHRENELEIDVEGLEAILFIRRAEKLIELAKEKYGSFIEGAGVTGGWENVDVNQLMQVLTPGQEVTDIDSTIFAAPNTTSYATAVMMENMKPIHQKLAEPYKPSPMAETFNSVVEAKAVLERSGILRQNFVRQPGVRSFMMDGYFEPQDLEALLYLYRNNDPMVFPEKDANGLPKDKVRSIWNSLSGKPVPEGYVVTPPQLEEGDTLHRTHITSDDSVLHIAYDRNGDQAFYKCTRNGNLLVVGREPEGTRGKVPSMFADLPKSAYEGYADRAVGITEQRMSVSIAGEFENGVTGLADLLPGNTSSEKAILPTGNEVLNRMITEGGGLRRGEWPGVVSATTPAEKSLVKPDDSPERLDVTGRPLPKFIITDSIGGNAVEKDLTVLREMDSDDLSESLDWIIKGYPLSERDDQRFIGFTLNDFVKVAAERIKQLQSDNLSLQGDVSGLQHQIDN